MSVLIKGMEMPISCGFCLFEKHTDDGYECCINGCLTEYQKRPSDCPLVPVPPHGRLIDADALIDWIYSDEPNAWKAPFRLCTADRSDVKFLLKQAPTIIPADKEVVG